MTLLEIILTVAVVLNFCISVYLYTYNERTYNWLAREAHYNLETNRELSYTEDRINIKILDLEDTIDDLLNEKKYRDDILEELVKDGVLKKTTRYMNANTCFYDYERVEPQPDENYRGS